MPKFVKYSPKESQTTTEYDEAGDFLAQFLASNPQNSVVAAPPPPVSEPVKFAAPAPVAPASAAKEEGDVSLANLFPDLFETNIDTLIGNRNGPGSVATPAPAVAPGPEEPLPSPFDILPPLETPTPAGELSPAERKRREKQAKLERKGEEEARKREEKARKVEQMRSQIGQKDQQRLTSIQKKALAEQAKAQKQEEAEQARLEKLRQKEQEKQAKLRAKEEADRNKLSKEQKEQEKQARLEQKAKEQQEKTQQKQLEKQIKLQQKQADKEGRLERKEKGKLFEQERKEKELIAQMGWLPANGEELSEEQKSKLDMLRAASRGGNGNTAIFVAVALALFMIAGFLVLAFFIIPPDISLGDFKAPDNSARYDVKSDTIDNVKKTVITVKGYDQKLAKRVDVEMLAATNAGSLDQISIYYNNLMKEKEYGTPQQLDPTLAYALAPRGVGAGPRPVFFKKDKEPDYIMVLMLVPLNNQGVVNAINSQVNIINSPVSPSGTLILMMKVKLPPG